MRTSVLLATTALVLAGCGGDDAGGGNGDGDTGSGSGADGNGNGDEPASKDITVAYSSGVPQVEKLPTNIALDQLEQDGFNTEIIYLESSEDPVNAVVRGDANFGSASASAVFTAIGQGVPITAIVQANRPNYVLAAPAGAQSPADLDGLRFGVHAEVSSTALYLAVALEDHPDAEPQSLVVPGSAARIEALAAGELDSSAIQLADLPRLEELAPGKFDVIWNFAQENPDLIDSVIFARTDALEEDPALAEALIEAYLDASEQVYDDVDGLAELIAELVPDTDATLAQELAKLHVESELWPVDGGLHDDGVTLTIDALTDGGLVEEPPDPAVAVDRTYLDNVLERREN